MNGDGSLIVIGSIGHGHNGIPSGAVWVVTNPGTALQSEVELLPSTPQTSMLFSYSLAMNHAGDVLVVGAPGTNLSAGNPDLFVFRFDGTAWSEELHVTSFGGDYMGTSAAINAVGDVFAVGRSAYTPPGHTYDTGGVLVHRRISGSWIMESVPLPAEYASVGIAQTGFGWHMTMSSDGATLAIGAGTHDGYSLQQNGAVFVYKYTGNTWNEMAKLQEPVAYSDGGFATAIAVDAAGETIVVGNPEDHRLAFRAGAATLFRKLSLIHI